MSRIYTIREASDILQVDATTLRRWDREGKIHCIRLSNNFRRVPEEEINRILGIKNNRVDAIYARVSSVTAGQELCKIAGVKVIHLI